MYDLHRKGTPQHPLPGAHCKALAWATFVAACGLLAAPTAQAASGDGGSGAVEQRPGVAATGLAKAVVQPRAADVVSRPQAAGASPAQPMSATPSDASTGFFMVTPISASWGGAGIDMQAAAVQNRNASGTSGTLQMELWATSTAPVFGSTITYYPLGPAYRLGTLEAGFEFTNLNSGTLTPYTPPPNGCYFVTVALQEFTGSVFNYVDLATFNSNGVSDPGGSGFDLFAFGVPLSTCGGPPPPPPPPPCTANATTGCLLNGRFMTTVRYRSAFDDNAVDSTAFLKSVTGFSSATTETAFFYFSDQNNIEMMVKVLDQGNENAAGQQTIAVLIGTATPLRIELTMTDTLTGAQKVYISHFPFMVGDEDFTAFVK